MLTVHDNHRLRDGGVRLRRGRPLDPEHTDPLRVLRTVRPPGLPSNPSGERRPPPKRADVDWPLCPLPDQKHPGRPRGTPTPRDGTTEVRPSPTLGRKTPFPRSSGRRQVGVKGSRRTGQDAHFPRPTGPLDRGTDRGETDLPSFPGRRRRNGEDRRSSRSKTGGHLFRSCPLSRSRGCFVPQGGPLREVGHHKGI